MTRSVAANVDFVRIDGLEEQMKIMQEKSRRNLEVLLEEMKQNAVETKKLNHG